MRTVDDVIRGLPPPPAVPRLKAPRYTGTGGGCDLAMAVGSMRDHTTNEGWELFKGLEAGGFNLVGHGLTIGTTDLSGLYPVPRQDVWASAFGDSTCVLQDKREWEGRTAGRGFDARETFRNVGVLKGRPDVFKGTVLKDAHRDPEYHRDSAEEIDAQFWITYYHPRIVKHLAPYVREEHLVRTYHSVDADKVPAYTAEGRFNQALLSGAVSGVYPLRTRLVNDVKGGRMPGTTWLPHPGYGRDGCHTPSFLQTLSRYKVAICTSSSLGYAVRKIIEATACGCRVVTDLPIDDILPGIDGNMYRVKPDCPTERIAGYVRDLIDSYDPSLQEMYAAEAKARYDYRVQGRKLAADIEALRRTYKGEE